MNNKHNRPILVTGAAGAVGAIGRNVTTGLLATGFNVRALVRREDERSAALRELGAEVVVADLTDLTAMHRAIEGVSRIYFGMSVSATYLEATVNTAAVARHHGVEAFVNMSQMTVTQMSITDSPQHKLHWLAEQALDWAGLPVVTLRPTVFMEGFFLRFAAAGIRDKDELILPLGDSRTSPVSAVDVAEAVTAILSNPGPHIGKIYNLTGPTRDRSRALCTDLLGCTRPDHSLSRRPYHGLGRNTQQSWRALTCRPASLGDGGAAPSGPLRPVDRRFCPAGRTGTDQHARLR